MKQTEDILTNYFSDLKTSKVPGQQNLIHLLDKADKGLVKSTVAKSLAIKKWIWIMNSIAIIVSAGVYMASLSMGDSGNSNQSIAFNPKQNEIKTSDETLSSPEENAVDSFVVADTTKRKRKEKSEEKPPFPTPPEPPAPPAPPSAPQPEENVAPSPPEPPKAPEIKEPIAPVPELPTPPKPPKEPDMEKFDEAAKLADKTSLQASLSISPNLVVYQEVQTTKNSAKDDVVRVGREIVNFSKIKLESVIDLVYTQSDKATLEIEGEAKYIDRVSILVKGGTLHVDIEGTEKFNPKQSVTVYVSSPKLEEVETNGTGDITIKNTLRTDNMKIVSNGTGDVFVDRLECKQYKVLISGTGNVKLADGGDAEESDIKIDGTGDFNSGDQKTRNVSIKIDGTGSSYVKVLDKLKVKIDGTGDVTYSGSPSDVYTNINGLGKVKKK